MQTGFDSSIERATAKYAENMDPAWKVVVKRLKAERRIASKLVTTCLRNNMTISVSDGEEWVVRKSSSKAEIMAALGSTDEDWLRIYHGSAAKAFIGSTAEPGKCAGFFRLVYGNADDGSELIADYTDNRWCNAIFDAVYNTTTDAKTGPDEAAAARRVGMID